MGTYTYTYTHIHTHTYTCIHTFYQQQPGAAGAAIQEQPEAVLSNSIAAQKSRKHYLCKDFGPGSLQNLTPVTFSQPRPFKNQYFLRKTKVSALRNLQNLPPVT